MYELKLQINTGGQQNITCNPFVLNYYANMREMVYLSLFSCSLIIA
jgi:hypothetical protein